MGKPESPPADPAADAAQATAATVGQGQGDTSFVAFLPEKPPPELAGLFLSHTLLTAAQVKELQAIVEMIRQKDNGRAIRRLNDFFDLHHLRECFADSRGTPSSNPPTRADQLTSLRAECLRVAQVCQQLTSAGVPADWPGLIRGLQRRATAEAVGDRIPPLFPVVATTEAGAIEQLDQLVTWIDAERKHLEGPPNAVHSPDFRSVIWFETKYSFTAQQAVIVGQLWAAWEQGTPDVAIRTLLANLKTKGEPDRLQDVFKKKGKQHPAWGTMIGEGETKGTLRLKEGQQN